MRAFLEDAPVDMIASALHVSRTDAGLQAESPRVSLYRSMSIAWRKLSCWEFGSMASDANLAIIERSEKEYGRVRIRVVGEGPATEHVRPALRTILRDWLFLYPGRVIDRAEEILENDRMIEIRARYHDTPSPGDESFHDEVESRKDFGVVSHPLAVEQHPGEYIDAFITEALETTMAAKDSPQLQIFVSRRRLAVILNPQAFRGTVVPLSLLEPALASDKRNALQAWVASPDSRFFHFELPKNRFEPQD